MGNLNIRILSAGDDASRNSIQIDSGDLVSASFHMILGDSTAAGTFKIQASNDVAPPQISQTFTVTNWVDVPSASVTITAGTRQALITIGQMSYRWVRAVWTSTTPGNTTIVVNMDALSV